MTYKKLLFVLLSSFALEMAVQPPQANDETSLLPTVVSLDYCADQYVLALADKKQIKAVSNDATELFSFYRARAVGLKTTHSTIPEVIALLPDIALQSYTIAPRMPEMAQRTGIKMLKTKFGSSPDIVIENVMAVGNILGRHVEAKKMANTFRTRIDKLRSLSPSSTKIAYVTPSGFTSGVGTFVDGIIELSGFQSYAASKGYKGWLLLPLEDLIADPPDMIVTSFFDTNLKNQSNWSLSRHDRLRGMMETIPTIHLPGSYLACNGLFLADAAETIRTKAFEYKILHKEVKNNE